MSEEKKEECGVIGIVSKQNNVAQLLYRAMMALQHRGQDACGMALVTETGLKVVRGVGLVSEVIKEEHLKIKAHVGIAHTRYPTAGECFLCDVQPFSSKEIGIAHNGQISNYQALRKEMEENGERFESSGDSEVILKMIDQEKGALPKSIENVFRRADGAYSIAAIIDGKLVVFRDSNEFRPLVYGKTEDTVCFASESAALDINNIKYIGNVSGGEVTIVENKNNNIQLKTIQANKSPKPRITHCMFEYVYFSRPDSIINNTSVVDVRKRLGQELAKEHPVKADVVIPVPDTSRTAAQTFASALGIEYDEGLIKNRYIGRTFIMPTQGKRAEAVQLKISPVRVVIENKKVVLVDDSIVRGTTLREIVALVRKAGAKEIHLRITCPPIKAPCYYGVDMKTYEELIANNKTVDEIRKYLGADSLGYLSIEGLKRAIYKDVCTGCLNQDYPTKYGQERKRNIQKKGM